MFDFSAKNYGNGNCGAFELLVGTPGQLVVVFTSGATVKRGNAIVGGNQGLLSPTFAAIGKNQMSLDGLLTSGKSWSRTLTGSGDWTLYDVLTHSCEDFAKGVI